MFSSATELLDLTRSTSQRLCLGNVLGIASDGQPVVTYPGCQEGGVEASLLVGAMSPALPEQAEPVLLLFLDDQQQPIILGAVTEQLPQNLAPKGSPSTPELLPDLRRPDSALVDGKRVVIAAQNEIVLKCGMSSIVLRRDGKVLVKGKRIVSRASETNRIQGGSVLIN